MVDTSKELYPSHLYISKDVRENFSFAETYKHQFFCTEFLMEK